MKVSIIISTYNGEKDVCGLLDSILGLESNNFEMEVILRDDSSTDKTVQIIERKYSWVQVVHGEGGNVGFVESNNIAFAKSTGSIICCVNQDTFLHPRFIIEGVNVLQQNEEISGVNSNMIMPWVMSLEQFYKTNGQDLPTFEFNLTPYGYVRYEAVEKVFRTTNFMTGGGFFIRRSVVDQNGYLFDPAIDMYCEDTELSLRLLESGAGIMYCPRAIIYHNQRPRKARTLTELNKLIHITHNRFALFARRQSILRFAYKYPAYTLGILLKMSHLGLPDRKKIPAFLAGTAVMILFIILFPYWLVYSAKWKKTVLNTK